MFIASTKIPEREGSMSTARLIVPHVSSFIYSVDELSFKGVTTWGKPVQDFILLFCVWCKSRELGDRGSSRFSFVTPVMETFSSDRVVFRIPSNISDGALLRKQPTALTHWLLPQKSPTTDFRQNSKYGSNRRWCECGVCVDCRCMEFVVAGWCARKWLRLYQTTRIRNLTFADFGSPNWKRPGPCISWTCLRKEGRRGSVV